MVKPTLLTSAEVAKILQVSPRTLASWRGNFAGELNFVRLGNRTIRYRQEDVEEFIASNDLVEPDDDDDEYYD